MEKPSCHFFNQCMNCKEKYNCDSIPSLDAKHPTCLEHQYVYIRYRTNLDCRSSTDIIKSVVENNIKIFHEYMIFYNIGGGIYIKETDAEGKPLGTILAIKQNYFSENSVVIMIRTDYRNLINLFLSYCDDGGNIFFDSLKRHRGQEDSIFGDYYLITDTKKRQKHIKKCLLYRFLELRYGWKKAKKLCKEKMLKINIEKD